MALLLLLGSAGQAAQQPVNALRYRDVLPGHRPRRTRRECHVHKCDPRAADAAFTARKCDRRMGHMQPMGFQQADMEEVERVELRNGSDFYLNYVARAQPVVIAGAATAATDGVEWTDEWFENLCHLDAENGGRPWRSIIEQNKIIVTNTRWPLEEQMNFCDFIRAYLKPEYSDRLYLVSPLSDPGVQVGKHMQVPSALGCWELLESIHETRLWMSSGNTSSSLHFDTHENLMLQVAGTKSVYFWPPSESHKNYMDYHNRFGLSPVNPDKVDLDRFPMFAHMRGGKVAHLRQGDALLIPDGYWHQVRPGE